MKIPEPDITITSMIDQAHEARTEKPRAQQHAPRLTPEVIAVPARRNELREER
jgi:hypothetical protein